MDISALLPYQGSAAEMIRGTQWPDGNGMTIQLAWRASSRWTICSSSISMPRICRNRSLPGQRSTAFVCHTRRHTLLHRWYRCEFRAARDGTFQCSSHGQQRTSLVAMAQSSLTATSQLHLWSSPIAAPVLIPAVQGLPSDMVFCGNQLFTVAAGKLYRTDITTNTTVDVFAQHASIPGNPMLSGAYGLTLMNNLLFFNAAAIDSPTLWRLDTSSPITTPLLVEVHTAPATTSTTNAQAGGTFYFAANNALWKTQGTPATTSLVATLPTALSE